MCDENTGRAGLGQPQQAMADFEKAYPGLSESMVDIQTADGTCDAFFVHPTEGKHPGVIFWPDAIALRDAKMAMARRLASSGYAVLVVNQYYRDAHTPLGIKFSDFGDPAAREKIMPLMAGVRAPGGIERDAQTFAAWLDAQPSVDTARGIGTQGYCMGGALAFRTAAAVPDRVKAVASFHGGSLVSDAPDSPHRLMAKTRASYLILPGQDDDKNEPDAVAALREAAAAAGRPAEIEVYKANHGWCVPDAPSYDKAEADRAWDRLLALYAGL
ncbi:dienelactone hydrolase family protein [Novosphingobium sp. G106]|uniref:dienelactone hydrolase family protein n=1 Tax=Novosphingobium sp. G106 TaxID=2849500 RepID=UPI001C2D4493|nr:dienelactone hydrolase family protein [Novosphingobium sp. G106]MBV1689440.1 dienelactone hydrolase family protein [Novosphingobium sp. G106]